MKTAIPAALGRPAGTTYSREEVVIIPSISMEFDRVRGQGRPRFGRGHTYELSADKKAKAAIADKWSNDVGENYGEMPVSIRIDVFGKTPKSYPKSAPPQPNTFKPDVDNIAKLVMDALNGVAYKDDSQVVELTVKKWNRVRKPKEAIIVSVWPE